MRQWPSSQYTLVKRSFFTRGTGHVQLDNYVSALKGVYSSIRLCSLNPSMGGAGTGLAVNVDVANGTFWTARKSYFLPTIFSNSIMLTTLPSQRIFIKQLEISALPSVIVRELTLRSVILFFQ